MHYVKVFLRRALTSFDRVYTYSVPENLATEAVPGRRVLIPFGRANRLDEAFIFSRTKLSPKDKADKIKPIAAILDDYPLLDENQLKLLAQMKQRYTCTYGQAASAMLPSGFNLQLAEDLSLTELGLDNLEDEFINMFIELAGLNEDVSKTKLFNSSVNIDEFLLAGYTRSELIEMAKANHLIIQAASNQNVKRDTVEYAYLTTIDEARILLDERSLGSIQQEAAVEYLLTEGDSPVHEILEAANIKRGTLKTLEKKDLLALEHRKIDTSEIVVDELDLDLLPKVKNKIADDGLNTDQISAIETINNSITNNLSEEFLLYGITGSGKTEVYIRACKEALAQGKTAIVLVPEIGLTPQMLSMFNEHFPNEITVLHSGLSQKERFKRWELIKAGKFPLVIGARSAIFAPVKNLGLIVIDEEQEDTYESDNSPYYHATTIARLRSLNEGVSLVLGSATPSLESFHRANTGKSTLLSLSQRAGQGLLPNSEIIDLRKNWNSDTEGILSKVLIEEMQATLDREEQVLLFLNRRGFARTCLCQECGKAIECQNCSVAYTYHQNRKQLICHYCGTTENIPEACPSCAEQALILHGVGTQKLEELCHRLFPDTEVFRIDQDTSKNSKTQAHLFKQFRENKSGILIGTQMIAKGHNFPRLTLVGVISADQMIARNDFRANEKAFQLITQVAGRAGRDELAGKVIIQAYDLDHYVIQTSAKHDFDTFSREELSFREALDYPPNSTLAYISISSESEGEAKFEANKLYNLLAQLTKNEKWENIRVLRPAPASLYKLQGRWRWNIVLKSSGASQVQSLSTLWQQISLKPFDKKVRISFRLDPA